MLSDFIAYGEIDLCPCLPVGETMRGEARRGDTTSFIYNYAVLRSISTRFNDKLIE